MNEAGDTQRKENYKVNPSSGWLFPGLACGGTVFHDEF